MSQFGTQATVQGAYAKVDASASAWPGVTEDDQVVVQDYTFQPVFEVNKHKNNVGKTFAKNVPEVEFELVLNFIVGAPSVTNTEAGAKAVKMPLPMAKIVIINADNADINGTYNFEGGSFTGSNADGKKGTITLRAQQGADMDPANKVAFNAIS